MRLHVIYQSKFSLLDHSCTSAQPGHTTACARSAPATPARRKGSSTPSVRMYATRWLHRHNSCCQHCLSTRGRDSETGGRIRGLYSVGCLELDHAGLLPRLSLHKMALAAARTGGDSAKQGTALACPKGGSRGRAAHGLARHTRAEQQSAV